MKASLSILLILFAASARLPASARRTQGGVSHFSKDGLSFDYPEGWTLEDKSNAELQHLVLRRPGSPALVMVMAERQPLRDAGQLFMSRLNVTQPYAENLARQLGARLPQMPDNECLPVGESFAAGYKLAGRVGQEPGTGEIYALVKGQRLVHLVHIRHDKDEPASAPAWKSVVDTLKVEPPANLPPGAAISERIITGGVLEGHAKSKPQPYFPPAAKAARASGAVVVRITVDEKGEVTEARALSGHPLLRGAGEEAARRAKFSPTMLCGEPVKVTGTITYRFVIK